MVKRFSHGQILQHILAYTLPICVLNGLFNDTSTGCTLLVQPAGITAVWTLPFLHRVIITDTENGNKMADKNQA